MGGPHTGIGCGCRLDLGGIEVFIPCNWAGPLEDWN
jgi:hypothetical protein